MNTQILMGIMTMVGALGYNIWGFIQAYKKTVETPQVEVFNWLVCATTVLPSLVIGFLAGYAMTPSTALDFIALITSGFGVASAQGMLGINNFFK